MAVHLKGNLGLKSSVLAPTASKLSTQYLVVDHMTHHYTKIDQVGSSIDTGPPRSLVTSQKLRDRRFRDLIINSLHPQLTSSLPLGSVPLQVDHLCLKPGHVARQRPRPESRSQLLDKPMRNNITFESAAPVESYMNAHMLSQMTGSVYNRSQLEPNQRSHVTAWHTFNSGYPHLNSVVIGTHDTLRQTYSGDVLDVRAQYFTEPTTPFVPRTLKTSHESRLKHSRCYNPARAARAASRQHESSHTLAKGQRSQYSSQNRHLTSGRHASVQASLETSQLEQSTLMDITTRSTAGQYTPEAHSRVPPVAMSRDMKRLQEKSRPADIQESRLQQQKPSVQATEQLATSGGESSLKEAIKRELRKRDEEDKYLMFAKEVTGDVLSRGICSDSVVVRVCENHVERRKHELDLTRLRAVVRELLASLGLQETSGRAPVASLSDTDYEWKSLLPTTHSYSHTHSDRREVKPSNQDSQAAQKHGSMSDLHKVSSLRTVDSELSSDRLVTFTCQPGDTGRDNLNFDLTLTRALQQYQHDLTAKEETDEVKDSIIDSGPLESNGDRNTSERLTDSRTSLLEDADSRAAQQEDTNSKSAQLEDTDSGTEQLEDTNSKSAQLEDTDSGTEQLEDTDSRAA